MMNFISKVVRKLIEMDVPEQPFYKFFELWNSYDKKR